MTIKAILFDHDGTLVDSEVVHFNAWQEAVSTLGETLSEQDYRQYCSGAPTLDNLDYLVDKFNFNEQQKESLFDHREKAISDYLAKKPFPLLTNVGQVFSRVQKLGLKIAIVSGAHRDKIEDTLQRHNLDSYVDEICCADDVENNKPAPDVYLLALKKFGLQANQTVAIEDSFTGLTSAVQADIDCIVIPNEYSTEHDLSAATHTVKTLASAMDLIEERYSLS